MALHYTFQHELNLLNKKLMHLSTLVEDRVRRAVAITANYDEDEADSIIRSDYEIDEQLEFDRSKFLKILALHQPVAGDLRFIVAVIKINNEMERIADAAVSIALRVKSIAAHQKGFTQIIDYTDMSNIVIEMLKMSIDALVHRDSKKARKVFFLDDDVDILRDAAYDRVKQLLREDNSTPGKQINTYLVARHLERIADRASNIAEEVIHMVEGSIVRSN